MHRTHHNQKATCIDSSNNTYQISPSIWSSSSSNTHCCRRHCSSKYSITSCATSCRSIVEDIINTVGIWLHSMGPLFMFLLFVVMYYILTILFGITLFAINMSYDANDCIEGWSELDDDMNTHVKNLVINFDLAFTLAWTSFTTVGYGNISPSIQSHCRFLRLFSSFTSFCGILYCGFCSALMFVKLQNIHSKAPVTFSSSLCLLYGDGCHQEGYKPISDQKIQRDHDEEVYLDIQNNHDSYNTSPSTTERILPFPILEFRIVHNEANKKIQNSIVDASLSCAVGIVQSRNHPYTFIQSNNKIFETSISTTDPSFNMTNKSTYEEGRQQEQLNHNLSQNEVTIDNTIVDEQGTRNEESIQSFHNMSIHQRFEKVKVYPDKCPLFSSVWRICHFMDISSPFLKENVKEKIQHNGGRWPSDMNDYESIRSAIIPFQTLSVTLSGTSTISMKTVFLTKSYTFKDVFIGWKPVNLYNVIVHDNSSEFMYHIDLGSIHNIIPQNGGGQEPIIDADPS